VSQARAVPSGIDQVSDGEPHTSYFGECEYGVGAPEVLPNLLGHVV
jgi:hypothetical protein